MLSLDENIFEAIDKSDTGSQTGQRKRQLELDDVGQARGSSFLAEQVSVKVFSERPSRLNVGETMGRLELADLNLPIEA